MSENNRPGYSIHVDTLVRAPVHEVWGLLVDPVRLGELFWGSTVESDFSVGSSIVWKGVWEGKPFEDRGQILKREEGSLLQCSHWSPTSGTPDDEASRSILTFRLSEEGGRVRVVFLHENILTLEMKEHSEPMWRQLLDRLKKMLEQRDAEPKKAAP